MRLDLDQDPRVIVRVDCSPDPRGEEEPRPFFIGDRRIEVADVLDRWPVRDHGRSARAIGKAKDRVRCRDRTDLSAV